jgi:TrmH family RNA methyltransferase
VITSADNPRVKDVVRWRKARERQRDGVLVAEGVREVERALAAGLVARSLYVAPELLHRRPELLAGRSELVPGRPELLPGWNHELAVEVSARVLAKMAYRAEPEGVLGVFEIPQRALPANPTLVLVAVGIEKPGNLGAMARTADAAGADGLLVADASCDPWNPNAIRASTGAVFTLPIVEATLDDVAQLPLQKVAAVVGAPTSYTDVDLRQPTALIVGAEDEGLDARWRTLADVQASIPMRAHTVDSLNAAASAALLLFEAVRQRGS